MIRKLLIEEWFLVLILFIQVGLVCMGVVSRTWLGWPISFTEEISRYLLIWLACLGFSACMGRREMIAFRWSGLENTVIARWLHFIRYTAVCIFFAILLFQSLRMVIEVQWRFGQTTSVMGWPIVWVGFALPLGSLALIFRIFRPRGENRN